MKVKEWMTVDLVTVTPATTVTGATEMMRSSGVRHLLVQRAGELVGILSDRDLLSAHDEPGAPAQRRVSEVMSTSVHTVDADASIEEAVRTILSRHVNALPVLDEGRLVGIITTTDCLLALQPEPHGRA